jgi:acetylornithine deacetylase/succinyl-diaminopimelate desuccinylase-like protein
MTLAVLRSWARSGHRPQRDIVFAWLADEEAGGHLGARWLCREHPELFHRCTEAIGEVGGFSIPISAELTLYPIMTAEKGFAWARVTTEGRSGHGAQPERSNAIADLATIITRVSEHEFPRVRNDATDGYLTEVLTLFGINVDLGDLDRALSSIGPLAALAEPATRNSATPTMLSGGSSPNTRARQATVHLDCRSAGTPISELKQQVETLVGPTATVEWVGHGDPVEAPFRTDLVDTMHRSLLAHDGTAAVVPYMVSAGTDAKAFSSLGIRCYGFSPLQLARGMRFGDLFHGPDERVPIAGLRFGASVLDTFLLDA